MRFLSHIFLKVTMAAVLCSQLTNIAKATEEKLVREVFAETTSGCQIGLPTDETTLGIASNAVTISWSGQCIDGKVSGIGHAEANFRDQVVWQYDGPMINGLFNGQGTFHGPGGVTVSAVFHNAQIDGPIVLSTVNGYRYEGGWRKDRREGYGIEILPSGLRYEGQWHDGLPDGEGTLMRPSQTPYSGTWRHGCFDDGERRTTYHAKPSTCP
jgi:hypothetical protein